MVSTTKSSTTKTTKTTTTKSTTTKSTKLSTMGISSSILAGLGVPVKSQTTTTRALSSTSTVASSIASSVVISSTVAPSATTSAGTSVVPSSSASSSTAAVPTATAVPVSGGSVQNTILVLAKDADSVYTSTSGLNGYGIPFQSIIVPQSGIQLPALNSSATNGNFGGIIIHAEVSYDFGGGNWSSALTAAQWQQLYNYQTAFGVRMVRLDVYPGPNTDSAVVSGGCCGAGVEQEFSFTDVSDFATAQLKTGAGVSSQGLYHYPATITNTTRTKQIAQFAPSSDGTFPNAAAAAVINNFDGRQQMAFFTSMATQWNLLSNYAQHSWIHWMTRGLFAGRRRTLLGTQIDDVHLITDIYSPAGKQFRIRHEDLAAHIPWMKDINTRLPAGSAYQIELGHNGNGDIENATASNQGERVCVPTEAIEYDEQIDTALEFQKPLGTGSNIWPSTPTSYVWSEACANLDPLAFWFRTVANRDAFMHISHTFSHMSLNNATYSDTAKEIQFNIAWMKQLTIWNAAKFSANGLIPPAITGLHNGDAIKAWMDNGITAVVGDNTRPVLMNSQNEFWPLISNVANNGYDGLVIIPRWATTIYYNCDTDDCTLAEWKATSAGTGDFTTLLDDARTTNVRHLLGLHQDPYMFHQANLRHIDSKSFTVGSQSGQMSLLQVWTETITQELTRLTNWPIVSLGQDAIGKEFTNRMTRDNCKYNLAWNKSNDGKSFTSVTVTATNNQCGAPIPVTVPADASGSGTKDKIGADPLIMWVTLSGQPVTLTLSAPVAV
ncbi:hypothetical protein C1H76_8110 [Elsinoe australis]|uniref:Extracellular serine-rich protein n=1 Tax=Elsinoe australis TaxID=40998 RepID=A0A4V6DTB1_9PEZI|nr:hypothetical protein C1H76_8110 [Elsinoe australis]